MVELLGGGGLLRTIELLLVEDNPGDVKLTREALRETGVANNLTVARDGQEALQVLTGGPGFENRVLPDLVLLDLNLPKLSGHEVLKRVKSDERLKSIPVVVLSTSNAARDISTSYQSHANCYITKPVDYDRFIELIHGLLQFWFEVVRLPSSDSGRGLR